MGRSLTHYVAFLLTKMRADGRFLGFSRVCRLNFDERFFKCCSMRDPLLSDFALLFPELEDEVDPYRLVFIGNKFKLVKYHCNTYTVSIILSYLLFISVNPSSLS